jgi:ribosomal protein L15
MLGPRTSTHSLNSFFSSIMQCRMWSNNSTIVTPSRNYARLSVSIKKPQIIIKPPVLPENLHMGTLKPIPGSRRERQRVGRGIASSGRTCGRGNAGQNSRSGGQRCRGFIGGQTPLHLSVRKIGKPPRSKLAIDPMLVSLGRIQAMIDNGRVDPKKPISLRELYKGGINFGWEGIKVCARVLDAYFYSHSHLCGFPPSYSFSL